MKVLDNRKKSRAFMAVIGILVFVIAVIVFLKLNKTANTGEVETSYLMGAFAIDYGDLNAVAGDADYVFVGKVESEDGTEYRDYVTIETELGGTKEIGDPYTKYTISVMENIKGDLMMEKAIPIVKYGGVSEDGKTCYLFDGDELPVAGNTYIFFAYAQDDGSLLISGPVSNVQVNNEDAVRARGNAITYEDVKDACQNQIDSGRERAVSIYEAR